jgi:hypothetical protein
MRRSPFTFVSPRPPCRRAMRKTVRLAVERLEARLAPRPTS